MSDQELLAKLQAENARLRCVGKLAIIASIEEPEVTVTILE